ncbi:MAG: GTPase [Archaeoglobales archaeon]|nr:MAG: GTPase [Archaeoglobales archaeon]
MEDQIFIYFIGTAGSGKTYLTKAFSDFLDLKKISHIIVNLDPGVDELPYQPDVDVREHFTLDSIMERYKVGPNGAQIIGADLVGTITDDLKDEIELYEAKIVLIDTPGQMELFTLRRSGEIIVRCFGEDRSVMVYLFDPIVSKTPSGFVSLVFMASSAVFRLNLPQIQVLAKSDVLSEDEIDRILRWSLHPETLYDDLILERNLSLDVFLMLKDSGLFRPLIPVSAMTGFGMEDVYDGIQETFYGGEDL